MVNYNNGKIYKLVTDKDPSLVYIGSTTQKLNVRKSGHKKEYKRWTKQKAKNMTSFQIFKVDENPNIVLLENFPCSNKEELFAREREWIESNTCVNKVVPIRGCLERKQLAAEYKHRPVVLQRRRELYKQNVEKHREHDKIRYSKNKTEILKKRSQYYLNNKEKIKERRKVKITCGCGSTHRKSDASQHRKSMRHQKWMESQ